MAARYDIDDPWLGYSAEQRWKVNGVDINNDGLVTISDVFAWLEYIFFVPGDAMFYLVMQNQKIDDIFRSFARLLRELDICDTFFSNLGICLLHIAWRLFGKF